MANSGRGLPHHSHLSAATMVTEQIDDGGVRGRKSLPVCARGQKRAKETQNYDKLARRRQQKRDSARKKRATEKKMLEDLKVKNAKLMARKKSLKRQNRMLESNARYAESILKIVREMGAVSPREPPPPIRRQGMAGADPNEILSSPKAAQAITDRPVKIFRQDLHPFNTLDESNLGDLLTVAAANQVMKHLTGAETDSLIKLVPDGLGFRRPGSLPFSSLSQLSSFTADVTSPQPGLFSGSGSFVDMQPMNPDQMIPEHHFFPVTRTLSDASSPLSESSTTSEGFEELAESDGYSGSAFFDFLAMDDSKRQLPNKGMPDFSQNPWTSLLLNDSQPRAPLPSIGDAGESTAGNAWSPTGDAEVLPWRDTKPT